ncbi:MAG: pyridinium-3,5-bisthiocarboxylic acid mononucleotide nickel chelatase [Phycisphaeraceae bacterium]
MSVQTASHQDSPAEVTELVVNLDDAPGETIGHTVTAVLDAGALDAWWTPIGMKKNRPGVMLSVLVHPVDQRRLEALLLELTGSFGVRTRTWQRTVLDRRHETVLTPFGEARVKIGSRDGQDLVARGEHEDAAQLAQRSGTPLRLVQAAIDAEATSRFLTAGGKR